MVNPEQSWSGVIIKCSKRGGEIVAASLRSHTLFHTIKKEEEKTPQVESKCPFLNLDHVSKGNV